MTPAEIIARFRCSGRRFSGEWPCEICRGHAEQSVAALAAQGLVIVRAEDIGAVLGPNPGVNPYIAAACRLLDAVEQPARPLGTLQDVRPVRDGMSGRSDDPKAVEGLSAPQGWNRTVNAHGIPIVWKILDEGDLIVGSPLVADLDDAVEKVTDLLPESAITRYLRTSKEAADRG